MRASATAANAVPPTADAASVYRRAALVMAGCAGMVVLYAVLPGTHSVLHTWAATLVTLVLLWGYMLHRNHGRLPLRSDTLVLAGYTLTHFLPPLYLSMRHGVRFVDAFDVGELQPLVALAVGAGALVVIATFGAVHRRLGGTDQLVPTPAPSFPMSRAIPVILPVALVIVAARLYLLASGSYYWVYADEDFLFGRWYSVTNALSRYGLFIPIVLWMLSGSDPRWKKWAWLASAAELAWVLPSGARQALLETVLGFLLVAWWRNGKLPSGKIAVILAVATLTMPILGEYRNTISRYTGNNQISLEATTRALWDARDRVGLDGMMELSDRFIDRMYDGQYFAYLIKHYRDAYDFEYGKTYADRIPYVAVPYFVGGGGGTRPTMQVPMELWFRLISRGSVPTTLFGEGYINFGFLGIPLIAAALGAVLALYEAAYRRLRKNVFVDAVYLMHASMLPYLVSTSMSHWLAFLRNALLMMVAILVLTAMIAALRVRRPEVTAGLAPGGAM